MEPQQGRSIRCLGVGPVDADRYRSTRPLETGVDDLGNLRDSFRVSRRAVVGTNLLGTGGEYVGTSRSWVIEVGPNIGFDLW